MRLLLDANLSPRLVDGLTAAGHGVRHVDAIGLLGVMLPIVRGHSG